MRDSAGAIVPGPVAAAAEPSQAAVGTAIGCPLIQLDRVSLTVGGTTILSAITLDISAGGPLVLIGPNGSGKTSLLKIAMGLMPPTSGAVRTPGAADGRGPVTAFVFQKPVMLRRTVAANVAFALASAGRRADEARVAELLARVGLSGLERRPARRLSGGEQQRLALARALARVPDVLLLDEPTASLDPHATKAVEDIIATVAAEGTKIVMATHDLGQARRLGREIVLLVKGAIAEQAAADRFFTTPATKAARRFLAGDLVL